jgi:hypothetical protein
MNHVRKIVFLLSMFACGLSLTGCSTIAPVIRSTPEGEVANTIYIDTADSPAVAYEKLVRLFQSRGHTIQESDPATGHIATAPFAQRLYGSFSIRAAVTGSETGSRIQLIGRSHSIGITEEFTSARGTSDSVMGITWNRMEEVAAGYSGGTVSYARVD